MAKYIKLLCLALLVTTFLQAQTRTDKKLQRKIESLVQGFNGEVGIYVKNVRTGKIASYHADTIFPTASMIKIPILIGVMDKIQKGELNYLQELIYTDSLLYAGVDILGSYKKRRKNNGQSCNDADAHHER